MRWLRWLADVTAQNIVSAVLGSAFVTTIVSWAVRQYATLSWEVAWILWTATTLVAFIALTVVLKRWHPAPGDEADKKPKQTAVQSPRVTIFTHESALKNNPLLPSPVEQLFRDAGWEVSLGRTPLERHRDGVWVLGGSPADRLVLTWALKSIGIDPREDDADTQPNAHIVVGASGVTVQGGDWQKELAEKLRVASTEFEDCRQQLQERTQERDKALATIKSVDLKCRTAQNSVRVLEDELRHERGKHAEMRLVLLGKNTAHSGHHERPFRAS